MAKENGLDLNGGFQTWLFRVVWTALIATLSIVFSGAIFQNRVDGLNTRIAQTELVDAVMAERVDNLEENVAEILKTVRTIDSKLPN